MRLKIILLLTGMALIMVGYFLFVTMKSKVLGDTLLCSGVLLEILAASLFIFKADSQNEWE